MAVLRKVLRFTEQFHKGRVRGKGSPAYLPHSINTRHFVNLLSFGAHPCSSTGYTEGIKLPQHGSKLALICSGLMAG